MDRGSSGTAGQRPGQAMPTCPGSQYGCVYRTCRTYVPLPHMVRGLTPRPYGAMGAYLPFGIVQARTLNSLLRPLALSPDQVTCRPACPGLHAPPPADQQRLHALSGRRRPQERQRPQASSARPSHAPQGWPEAPGHPPPHAASWKRHASTVAGLLATSTSHLHVTPFPAGLTRA